MSDKEIWQIQIRKKGEPLPGFLRQGDGNTAPALQEAVAWRRQHEGDDNLVIFITIDPEEFVTVDRG